MKIKNGRLQTTWKKGINKATLKRDLIEGEWLDRKIWHYGLVSIEHHENFLYIGTFEV